MDNAAVRSLCPQRHEHSPPPARVPSTARSPLLPLPSVTLLRLAITFAQLEERVPSRISLFLFLFCFFEPYNILRFALMFFFLLNCERTRKNLFRKCLGPHQSYCMPTAAARERCLPHFLTAKTSHASERQPPTPHRLH